MRLSGISELIAVSGQRELPTAQRQHPTFVAIQQRTFDIQVRTDGLSVKYIKMAASIMAGMHDVAIAGGMDMLWAAARGQPVTHAWPRKYIERQD